MGEGKFISLIEYNQNAEEYLDPVIHYYITTSQTVKIPIDLFFVVSY